MKKEENSGLYQLLLRLPKRSRIKVGKLGTFDFPAGYYIYTGSAKRGLSSRIRRHRSTLKRQFWHIDYLLAESEIHDVRLFTQPDLCECDLACRVASLPKAKITAPGFGASDCSCRSHLAFFEKEKDLPAA